ncbi:AAA family ATPase [Nonomuraea soli]|uniref:Putative ATPase n=1 Tax=Nonomuraea soli TaxID=1032476 RepID=A0A7W0CKW7_9ACTN|nr:AAA family ATPase [Nonomuraea soli]MBA2892949.1 putative ATPase [Nonomuraea soli]
MITTLAVENYRSLRRLVIEIGSLTVVTGANGSGKSNLYRALRLLSDAGRNGAVAALAREGGLESTLWAGPEQGARRGRAVQGTVRSSSVSLKLGFAGDDLGYAVDFGLPVGGEARSAFNLDPEIKSEAVWGGPILRPATLLAERHGPVARVRGDDGWEHVPYRLQAFDSVLAEVADLDLLMIRERIRSWRFYDHLRTDAEAPARMAQIGTRTPVLGHDGADLAAALQTIIEIGDADALDKAVSDAFPGSAVQVAQIGGGRLELQLRQHGLLRPLSGAELSDGTLRYLLLVAALLTPRPPALLVLNEPETSLHPDLLEPLAELVSTAAGKTQLVLVSHARPLVAALAERGASVVELVKELGETRVEGYGPLDGPAWTWPKR